MHNKTCDHTQHVEFKYENCPPYCLHLNASPKPNPTPKKNKNKHQNWEFDLSLFTLSFKIALLKAQPLAIRSHCSLKEQTWANRSCCSLQKSDESQSHFRSKQATRSKNSLFSQCFLKFFIAFPICMPKSKLLQFLFAPWHFFLKSDGTNSLLEKSESLFRSLAHTEQFSPKTKEWIPNPDKHVLVSTVHCSHIIHWLETTNLRMPFYCNSSGFCLR